MTYIRLVLLVFFCCTCIVLLRKYNANTATTPEPVFLSTPVKHPIHALFQESEAQFNDTLTAQSRSINEAVAEYRQRYQMPPPPHFDTWYEFAKEKGVQNIDEYDSIYEMLLPFWALEPSTIRERARESIGCKDNMLFGLMIRNGKIVNGDMDDLSGEDKILVEFISSFVEYLPDMDVPFNSHDEPRVVVPHSQLSKMVEIAKRLHIPAAFVNENPINSFSSPPADLVNSSELMVSETMETKFNIFSYQAAWTHSISSCPPNSPVNSLNHDAPDNTSYQVGDVGFIRNLTGFFDICMSPSLEHSFGFFETPNRLNIIMDLFPVFSMSKISSFQDIVYPSEWYWANWVSYNEEHDQPWESKIDKLYWRGATTGGYSRKNSWRHQHRQHFLSKMTSDKSTLVMWKGSEKSSTWEAKKVAATDYQDMLNVKFVRTAQCDQEDCEEQKMVFDMVQAEDLSESWKYKHLLDLDGNAYSARFYSQLHSGSLVYKMSINQEWHKDWLKPWAHYIPLTLRGGDWLEALRYFSEEEEGKLIAKRIAMQGREWAQKSLRKEDMEVWFLRLLLEYGRLIDDNRENIGL